MNTSPGLIWLILLMAIGCHRTAIAHTLSESISSWQIDGAQVTVQFIVPDLEAKRLSTSGKEVPTAEVMGQYLAANLGAKAGGKSCDLAHGPRALSATPGFSRYELAFRCTAVEDIRVHSSAFYALVPSHTDFARIQNGANFAEQLLTRDRQEVPVTAGVSQNSLEDAGLLEFVRMGILHILTGLDHLSFMLGLVLISRRVKDLVLVVSGFTIGHSLTLGLAVTGILRPDSRYIDSLVALTIALIGAEIIGEATRRPLPLALGLGGLMFAMAVAKALGVDVSLPMTLLLGGGLFAIGYLLLTGQMPDAAKVRLVVTLVFGLIHGFGFASNLLEMRLPTHRLAELLVGFNLGVEISQLAVVFSALLAANFLVRMRLSIARPLFTDLAASFLVGEGLYWFLGRSVILG